MRALLLATELGAITKYQATALPSTRSEDKHGNTREALLKFSCLLEKLLTYVKCKYKGKAWCAMQCLKLIMMSERCAARWPAALLSHVLCQGKFQDSLDLSLIETDQS